MKNWEEMNGELECHSSSQPADSGWELGFSKLDKHGRNCPVFDFMESPKKGECTCGYFKKLAFIRDLLQKAKAEGIEQGRKLQMEDDANDEKWNSYKGINQ